MNLTGGVSPDGDQGGGVGRHLPVAYRTPCGVFSARASCQLRQFQKIKKATGFANLPLFSALQLSSYCNRREQEALRNREQLRHSKNGCPLQQ